MGKLSIEQGKFMDWENGKLNLVLIFQSFLVVCLGVLNPKNLTRKFGSKI
jgi:hypothetical protein